MCIPCSALNGTVKVHLRFSYRLRLYTSFIIEIKGTISPIHVRFKVADFL